MSHDMRTLLNAIIGLSGLAAQHTADPGRVAECLDKIGSASRYLLGLINDILEMSRLEHGQIPMESRRFDLRGCMEECLAPFQLQAEAEKKTLKTDVRIEGAACWGMSSGSSRF